ncbi:MAG: hypothetical protein GY798_12245, partial [Hyphomicrobiales bacterium]|nr:hypothetical protein [Hyphomicrobiales bacterium]
MSRLATSAADVTAMASPVGRHGAAPISMRVSRGIGGLLVWFCLAVVAIAVAGSGAAQVPPGTDYSDPFAQDIDDERRGALNVYYRYVPTQKMAKQRLDEVMARLGAAGFSIPVASVVIDPRLINHGAEAGGMTRGLTSMDGQGNVTVRLNPAVAVAVAVDEEGDAEAFDRPDGGLLTELTLIHEFEHVRQFVRYGRLPRIIYAPQFANSDLERAVREAEAYQAQFAHDDGGSVANAPAAVRQHYREEFEFRRDIWTAQVAATGQQLAFDDTDVTIDGSGRKDVALQRDAHIPENTQVLVASLPDDLVIGTDELAAALEVPQPGAFLDRRREAERIAFPVDPLPRFSRGATQINVGIRARGRTGDVVVVAVYRDHLGRWQRAEVAVHVNGSADPDTPDDDGDGGDFDETVLPALEGGGEGDGGETPLALPEARGYAAALIGAANEMVAEQLALEAVPEDAFILPAPEDAATAAEADRSSAWDRLLGTAADRLGSLGPGELADLRRLLAVQKDLERQAMQTAYAEFFALLPAETQDALIAGRQFYQDFGEDFEAIRGVFRKYRFISTMARLYYDKGASGLLEGAFRIGCHTLMGGAIKLASGAMGSEYGSIPGYITASIGTRLESVACDTFLPALFQEGTGESWLTGVVVLDPDPEVDRWVKIFYSGEIMAGVDEPDLPSGIDFYFRERVAAPEQVYRKFRTQPRLHEALRDHWRSLYVEYPELRPYLDLDDSDLARRIWQRLYRVAGAEMVAAVRDELAAQATPPPPRSPVLEDFRDGNYIWPPPENEEPAPRVISAESGDLGEVALGDDVEAIARLGVLGLAGIDEDLSFDWTVEGPGLAADAITDRKTVIVHFPEDRVDPVEDLFKIAESRFMLRVGADLFEAGEAYEIVARVAGTAEVFRFPFRTSEEERVATCNSAVGAGSDAPETVRVDIGGYVGKASFEWEMYTVKDRMQLHSGGALIHDTGCVNGSDIVVFDTSGADTLTVTVSPNCEGTTGTKWEFKFACPAEIDGDGSGGGSGQATAEVEPNDTPAEATAIAVGAAIDGTIQPLNDADHYVVDLTHQGELRVLFLSVPPELNMAFRVHAAAGGEAGKWNTATSEGTPYEDWVDIAEPGRYIIEVRDGHNTAESTALYRMTTVFTPTPDTGEPNDTPETSTSVAIGEAIQAAILPKNDADFYAVDIVRQGELTLRFPAVPEPLNMAFLVYDSDGEEVGKWNTATAEGAPFEDRVDIATPGRYLIEVRDGHNTARSPDPYEMVALLAETADTGEPNDDPASATPLALGTTIQAAILPKNDAD